MSTQVSPIQVASADGTAIAVRVHSSNAGGAKGSVVIGGAMGVKQDFYSPFAQWLAAQGYRVFSFDYRGMGDSRPAALGASLRGFEADLFAWAADFDAVIAHALQCAPGAPLYIVGHSLGAQLPGMLAHRDRIHGLVSVAAGSGYWRDNAPQLKRVALYFWYVLVPPVTALFGYFPGKRLRKVGDVPRGVMLQWRRWCLNPHYHVGAEGDALRRQFEAVRFPLVALSITDDELMTERGTRVLVDCYPNAPRRIERVAPADASVTRIGHFGLFRDQFQSTLWARVATLLQGFQVNQETA
jgi:predicted alpha/beta hydrolase